MSAPAIEPKIRPYKPTDREVVRKICADTGFLSNPIDPVFEDRELFADYLTSYYTDWEPESLLVLESNGEIRGYITGCRFPRRKALFEALHFPLWVIKGALRYLFRPYNNASKKFVRWIISNSRKETPAAPKGTPHFHINLYKDVRNVANTRKLIDKLFHNFSENGETAVYAQVVAYENRRSTRTFARYGLEVIDQREVTKYRDYTTQKIYLFTILKDLTRNVSLYGLDLKEELESKESASDSVA